MTSSTATDATSARGGGARGAVLLQAVASVSTVAQLAVFAKVLPRDAFDDYAVWITAAAFVIALGQAVGVERVLVGKRTFADGLSTATVLGVAIALGQAGVALALGSPVLMVCSLAAILYIRWDFVRFAREPALATSYYRRDLAALLAQAGVVGVLALTPLDARLLPIAWWWVGAACWYAFTREFRDESRPGLAARLGILRADGRESSHLLLDAALSGVPMLLALALARAQGDVGDASDARLAFAILGPVTVLGLAARRLIYRHSASGGLTRRAWLIFAGSVVGVFVACFVLLACTRTPLYSLVLGGFSGLAWIAIVGFALNHASLMAVMVPAAYLRARGRSRWVGLARIAATCVGVAVALALMPVDSASKVAWSVAAGSLAYLVTMWTAFLATSGQSIEVAAPDAAELGG